MSVVIRNATIVTMNDGLDVLSGDVYIDGDRIIAVGTVGNVQADRTINAAGGFLLPGFIQTHVHLCQTLFRGYADDRALLDWLRQRIWPMEAAHTASSLAASARLAASELLLGGTTAVLTMETVHDTDAVFEALEPMGLRAVVGKCMMDADRKAPARLIEQTAALDRRKRCSGQAVAGPRQRAAAGGVRATLCAVLLARAARGRRGPLGQSETAHPHSRVGEPRRDRARPFADRLGRTSTIWIAWV